MIVTVVTVHPAVVICQIGTNRLELPTDLFPAQPRPGQTWDLSLEHRRSDTERLDQLNSYLRRDETP